MSDDRYLTFALGKGRLAKKTLQLFEQIGITCEEMKDPDTRKLIFVNEELKLRLMHPHPLYQISLCIQKQPCHGFPLHCL